MPPVKLIDRLVPAYCADVPWVRAAVEQVLNDARREGERRMLPICCALVVAVVMSAVVIGLLL
jgi:hypothetical protein